MLYMFQAVSPPIIRSSKLYIPHWVLCQGLIKYPMLYMQFWAPDDGRRNRLKHIEHFTEINKLCNVASCWLYLKIRLRCMEPWTSEVVYCLCLNLCVCLQFMIQSTESVTVTVLSLCCCLMSVEQVCRSVHLSHCTNCVAKVLFIQIIYRGADKSLARPGR